MPAPISLGLDFGTTSVSVIAVRADGSDAGCLSRSHRADLGVPAGHAEQSPRRLFSLGLHLLHELAGGLEGEPVCLGLTGQMHGLLLADADLNPRSNLITWQDKRSLELADGGSSSLDRFRARCDADAVARTGCTPSAGYLAVTLFSLLGRGELPPAAAHALIFADWAAARLTGASPATDSTNAASTGVFDVQRCEWSDLIDSLGLPRRLFPPVAASGAFMGGLQPQIAAGCGLPAGLPVHVAIGDHQAAVLGSLAADDSSMHVNIGTGGQVSLPVAKFIRSPGSDTRYLPDGRYLLVGAGFAGGDALAWVKRTAAAWMEPFGICLSDDQLFSTLIQLAAAVPAGAEGLTCEPYFAGTRVEPHRRAVLRGVGRENFGPGHLLRAVCEGIGTALAEFARAHGSDAYQRVIATGNAVRNNSVLAESLAAAFERPLFVPEHREEAAYGAALLAGVRAGLWPNLSAAGRCLRLRQIAGN